MIEINNIVKKYGSGDTANIALNNLNLTLPEKKFITITGKSGCGKTTLLNLLGLIDKPSSGIIKVNGKNISKFKRKEILDYRRKVIGIVFQFFQLIPVLNVRDNILIANEFTTKVEKNYFNDIVKKLDIKELLHKYPDQLSGGQKQRVAIARAIINSPQILLADEPTGNLDSENSRKVIDLLRELANTYDMSLIIVTHDDDIAKQADINIRLVDGQLGGEPL